MLLILLLRGKTIFLAKNAESAKSYMYCHFGRSDLSFRAKREIFFFSADFAPFARDFLFLAKNAESAKSYMYCHFKRSGLSFRAKREIFFFSADFAPLREPSREPLQGCCQNSDFLFNAIRKVGPAVRTNDSAGSGNGITNM